MSKDYENLLLDPRWQKKRLEILQRDGWSCQRCGDTTKNLQVHHLRYDHSKSPWEYQGKDLTTLCESCHRGMHDKRFLKPVHVADVATQIQYEGLYKEEPAVIAVLNEQISGLNQKLTEPISDELQEEILKNIMFLQGKRKELLNAK